MASKISELLQRLLTRQDTLRSLQEMKTAVYSIPIEDLKNCVKNLSFEPVFAGFSTTSRAELALSREILHRLLECIEPDVVLSQFRDELYGGMGHPDEEIRILCVHQIERLVSSPEGTNNLKNDPDLVENVIAIVADSSLAVAKVGMKVLTIVGHSRDGCCLIFTGDMKDKLLRISGVNETVRYRVFEIATEISKSAAETLEVVANSGVLQLLLDDLNSADDLIQLNAIEMLCSLADCKHGLEFLDQPSIVGRLEEMLVLAENDPMQDFLLPGLIKFFGYISQSQPLRVSEKHPTFIKVSFDLLKTSEQSLQNIAIDTIGFLGSSPDGKKVLQKQGPAMAEALSILGRLIQVPPTEIRVRALSALASLFAIQTDHLTQDLEQILEGWFAQITSNPLELVLSLTRQPFLDIRCPSYAILQALCNQKWAQNRLCVHPGFKEFLLDRATEREKESKETKFDVVRSLAEAPYTAEVFGRPYLLKLREFVREGPFFVKTQSEVAMESSS